MKFLIGAWVFLSSAVVMADVRCVRGNAERKVKYEDVDKGCVIRVNDKVLYRAKHNKNYCKTQMDKHVKKLKELAFNCVG